jgi:hypothetical protein
MTPDANCFDLSALSYDAFLLYFFTNPSVNKWNRDADGNPYLLPKIRKPEIVIDHLTRLYCEFGTFAQSISLDTLNRGLDGMLSSAFLDVPSALWNRDAPLNKRQRCVESMYQVFADFVAKRSVEELPGSFYMWWDHICTGFWFGHIAATPPDTPQYARLAEDDKALVDTIFETLCKILRLDDDKTNSCALHGLGHLHHPGVHRVVQAFIDDLPDEARSTGAIKWLEQCRDGKVI